MIHQPVYIYDEIHQAIFLHDEVKFAHLLNDLSTHALINAKDEKGLTLLLRAIREGFIKGVELLLLQNIKINECDNLGATPCFFAAKRSQPEILCLLIKNGADFNTPNHKGLTPLSMALII